MSWRYSHGESPTTVLFLMDETVTPEISTLARSLMIEKKLSSMGIERRLYLLSQPALNVETPIASAIKEAQAKGAPSVVYVYGNGKVKLNEMPETATQLERLLNAIR